MLVLQAVLTIIHEVNLFQTSFIRTNQVCIEFYESLMFEFYIQKVYNDSHFRIILFYVPDRSRTSVNRTPLTKLPAKQPVNGQWISRHIFNNDQKNCDILKKYAFHVKSLQID